MDMAMDMAALGEALAEGATTQGENNSSCGAAAGADGENDACCAICLGALDSSANIALVKSCLHAYCVECVVSWASSRALRYPDSTTTPCPVCKHAFTAVYLQRTLDGGVTDHLVEESMVLLMRARWAGGAAAAQEDSDDSADGFDFDDEEEVLARQHRVRLIGNRRFGGGGFVASGRLLARPLPAQPAPRPAAAKKAPTAEASPAPKHPQKAKREAKAAQAQAKEAERRAKRLGRLLPASPALAAGAACEDEAAGAAC